MWNMPQLSTQEHSQTTKAKVASIQEKNCAAWHTNISEVSKPVKKR